VEVLSRTTTFDLRFNTYDVGYNQDIYCKYYGFYTPTKGLWACRARDHMVVVFTTTCAISSLRDM
jgi:hypothetical protein